MNQRRLLKIPINKKELALLRDDSFVWFSSLASLCLIILTSLLIFYSWNRLPPQIPLFYSRPWGEKQLASPLELWLLPAFSFGILTLNTFLAIFTLKKDILIRRVLAATALIVTLLCSIAAYKITSLIT
ncbi:MAG TPA: hypothetical protein VMW41_01110 [Candidatus Bathyarchaeia archaeon]|nr:hypothetical protein [Candidatus Bathyarchaeia archaeon]